MVVYCENKQQLNRAWNIVAKWAERNHIEVNKRKSAIMAVKVDQRTRTNPLLWSFNDIELEREYKCLGLQIVDELNMHLITKQQSQME